MKLIPVDKLPRTARGARHTQSAHKDLLAFLQEFVEMNVKYAKVEYDDNEYASAISSAGTFGKSCAKYGIPVKSVMRNHEIYLVRTDI